METHMDSFACTACSSNVGPKVTMDDALAYVNWVKAALGDETENYQEFLDILKEFKDERIDPMGVISRINVLFRGHPDLLLAFGNFLPKGYEIFLHSAGQPSDQESMEIEDAVRSLNNVERESIPHVTSSAYATYSTNVGRRPIKADALAYVGRVKDAFRDDAGKYQGFLDALKDHKAQRIDTNGLITMLKELFRGHPDLMLALNSFLPKGYEITPHVADEMPALKEPMEMENAVHSVNIVEPVHESFLAIEVGAEGSKDSRLCCLPRGNIIHHDLVKEIMYYLPDAMVKDEIGVRPYSDITKMQIKRMCLVFLSLALVMFFLWEVSYASF